MVNENFNNILEKVSTALDIPDYIYEDATIKYEQVGVWLASADSKLSVYNPEIYPQGSFRLGTVVRPISNEDEYDIDLVCNLDLHKEQTTQNSLKELVGKRLCENQELKSLLKESRRCWTLNYSSQDKYSQFHMDVLPSISNTDDMPTGILLSDKELRNWQKSNPKEYAEWFYKRIEPIFLEKRAAVAESMQASVEDVPEWQIKTPLQIAIQILKRHRDIYFQNDSENKPVSIIITTLAAHAYKGEAELYDALQNIVLDMPKHIKCINGKWAVMNPVADENFADKWNEYPKRKDAFLNWLQKVQKDFANAQDQKTLFESVNSLRSVLGENALEKAASDLGLSTSLKEIESGNHAPIVPALGSTSHCQRPWWEDNLAYSVKINSSIHFSHNGKKLWPHVESRSISKNMWIRFSLETSTPSPYKVEWQIVNTGVEAYNAGQLRGEFCLDGNIHWESTSYKGTHFVQAFIIKEGKCVAKSRRKIVKIR